LKRNQPGSKTNIVKDFIQPELSDFCSD